MVSPQSETGTPEKWLNGGGEDGEGWMREREGKEKGRGGEERGGEGRGGEGSASCNK